MSFYSFLFHNHDCDDCNGDGGEEYILRCICRCITVDRPSYHQVCDTEYVQDCDGGGYKVGIMIMRMVAHGVIKDFHINDGFLGLDHFPQYLRRQITIWTMEWMAIAIGK